MDGIISNDLGENNECCNCKIQPPPPPAVETPAEVVKPATPEKEKKAIKLTTKRWVKADGTITEKQYDQSIYAKKHYDKYKVKYTEKKVCECGEHYTLNNQSNHVLTKIHKLYAKMSKTMTPI
jgi:hypothetical protein